MERPECAKAWSPAQTIVSQRNMMRDEAGPACKGLEWQEGGGPYPRACCTPRTDTSPPASADAAPGGRRSGLGHRARCLGRAAAGCGGTCFMPKPPGLVWPTSPRVALRACLTLSPWAEGPGHLLPWTADPGAPWSLAIQQVPPCSQGSWWPGMAPLPD